MEDWKLDSKLKTHKKAKLRSYLAWYSLHGTSKMQNIIDMHVGKSGCGVHSVISFVPAFSSKNNRSDLGSAAASNF